ncbi:hypothetical protein C0Q70_17026 [Pomacea canaliculata]|uniref:Uncharacterized protein n=1 Tax=Pomacea canaliculata TaxID=400727 RepID=A0A2T7NRI2_POMCA|nr:hypothetical protein C0Q70_17026 [Pomacea canaliculata]
MTQNGPSVRASRQHQQLAKYKHRPLATMKQVSSLHNSRSLASWHRKRCRFLAPKPSLRVQRVCCRYAQPRDTSLPPKLKQQPRSLAGLASAGHVAQGSRSGELKLGPRPQYSRQCRYAVVATCTVLQTLANAWFLRRR